MESSKDKAIKSIGIAERKISENDYVGAKKFVDKAQNLYPKLDGLKQVSMMIDVYISASNRKGEADWYGVLGVEPLANDEAIKKQYKKLALLLHPDKNKFTGATEAFKLISEAWCLLSDKAQRFSYDLKRKSKDVNSGMQQKEPKRHKPDFSQRNQPKHEYEYESESDPETETEPDFTWDKAQYKREPDFSWSYVEASTFWTRCDRCNTYCQFGSDSAYRNGTLSCPNCRQVFVVTEIELEVIGGRRVIRFNKSRTDASSSSTSASASARLQNDVSI
ncbi:chaperone protein dnaJ 49-like isoform X1 [Raphanus sativus]|uniref:Chaperone protein dnaJ 49-like isoform X1 n=1 Tax=Raphanus sativus TaxID=3726 RepID=A0A9W3C8V4_RAPSA|nr:chaperone protein dnaJ 49-like isoform X1 [Raphanus sativus]